MRLDKVLGLADFLGKRGEAIKMLAQGARLLRDGQAAAPSALQPSAG
jgi:ribosomal 50S subunit-recycling heat shock protein